MSKKKKYRRKGNLFFLPQMPQRPTLFEYCDKCGKEIKYGNACMEVSRQVQQVDRDFITVIDSDPLLTVCATCGNRLWPEKIREHLRQLLYLDGMKPIRDQKHGQVNWKAAKRIIHETCDKCGAEIKFGNACVDVEWRAEQVDWDSNRDDDVITTIYAESVLMLCARCGNRFGTWKIKNHLELLLLD